MTPLKINHLRIIPGMLIAVFVFSACGLGSFINNDGKADPTPTINSIDVSDGNLDISSTPVVQEISEQKKTPDPITVFRLDGTQEEIPFAYTSSTDLLEAKIASGEWTNEEGLVILLKLFTGEIEFEDVPDIEWVLELNGTGVVRRANEYLAKEDNPEIRRLLAKLFPTQDVLDVISQPANQTSHMGSAKIAMPIQQASPQTCENMAENGFKVEFIKEGSCYIYEESLINGYSYRVYYPYYWQGDAEKEGLVTAAFKGLTDSVVVYTDLGRMENINMMFSLLPDPKVPGTLAFQTYAPKGVTCPLTLLPDLSAGKSDVFLQSIAHEVFHCFQDWNSVTDGASNEWWIEGTAEYFSNVVYPDVNFEHRFLSQFDSRSLFNSLMELSYENFIFFQHAANTYGNEAIINLQRSLGNANGASSALAAYDNMDTTFQEFVVGFASIGIKDTDGSMIAPEKISSKFYRLIDEERDYKYSSKAFVASRILMQYKKELRFLQEPKEDQDGKYSTVKAKERRDPSKWSALPPELRSTCKEDLKYLLVMTTTQSTGSYEFTAVVNKTEKAECDPCLLGVWQIDNDSFENYILGAMTSQGGVQGFPPGSELFMEVEGEYLMEFKENSELLSRRDNLSVTTGATGYPGFTSVIDAQGSGNYSTRDGKQLDFFDMNDYVNKAQGFMNGVPFSVNLMPGGGTYNVFGQSDTLSAEGYENSNEQASLSVNYVCNDETLTLAHPEYGDLLLKRVEKIMPTPIPTLSP